MCLAEREQLLYELGKPADLQHGLEECLLGDDHDPTEALVLKHDLERVCKSSTDYKYRLRRIIKCVLLAAAAAEQQETGKVRVVLGRLQQLLGEDLLESYLRVFKSKHPDHVLASAD